MPPRVIDVHTHIFSHEYVPVVGVLCEYVGLPRRMTEILAALLEALDQASGSGWVRGTLDAHTADDLVTLLVDRVMVDLDPRATRMAHGGGPTDPLYKALMDIEGFQGGHAAPLAHMVGDLLTALAQAPEKRTSAVRAVHQHRFGQALHGFLGKVVDEITTKATGVVQCLSFTYLLYGTDTDIRDALLDRAYNPGDNVQRFVHHMMDMEYGYPGYPAPELAYDVAIQRASALFAGSGGRLLGFVAFDPRRSDGLAKVKSAMTLGFTGVKIYPPMRYRPLDAREPLHTRLVGLYDWCTSDDIPVLAHTSPGGMQAVKGAGMNADPGPGLKEPADGWQAVLARWTNLRICFGHAGGEEMENSWTGQPPYTTLPGWDAEDDNAWNSPDCWPRKVVELCAASPNAYCDLSYFQGFALDPTRRQTLVANLLRAMAVPGSYRFSDKLLFGSDWHMPGALGETSATLAALADVFSHPPLKSWSDAFFYSNACRFLKLA